MGLVLVGLRFGPVWWIGRLRVRGWCFRWLRVDVV